MSESGEPVKFPPGRNRLRYILPSAVRYIHASRFSSASPPNLEGLLDAFECGVRMLIHTHDVTHVVVRRQVVGGNVQKKRHPPADGLVSWFYQQSGSHIMICNRYWIEATDTWNIRACAWSITDLNVEGALTAPLRFLDVQMNGKFTETVVETPLDQSDMTAAPYYPPLEDVVRHKGNWKRFDPTRPTTQSFENEFAILDAYMSDRAYNRTFKIPGTVIAIWEHNPPAPARGGGGGRKRKADEMATTVADTGKYVKTIGREIYLIKRIKLSDVETEDNLDLDDRNVWEKWLSGGRSGVSILLSHQGRAAFLVVPNRKYPSECPTKDGRSYIVKAWYQGELDKLEPGFSNAPRNKIDEILSEDDLDYNRKQKKDFEKERIMFRLCQGPYVCKYYGSWTSPSQDAASGSPYVLLLNGALQSESTTANNDDDDFPPTAEYRDGSNGQQQQQVAQVLPSETQLAYRVYHMGMEYLSRKDLVNMYDHLRTLKLDSLETHRRAWKFWYSRGLPALLRGMAQSIKAVHDLGIAHLDIKPRNMALNDQGRVCLIDFGLAQRHAEKSRRYDFGTVGYRMPANETESTNYELWNAARATLPESVLVWGTWDDIWSLGRSFQMMGALERFPLPTDITPEQFETAYKDVVYIPTSTDLDASFRHLIESMTTVNASKRFTIDQVLAHPFLKKSAPSDDIILQMLNAAEEGEISTWERYVRQVQAGEPAKRGPLYQTGGAGSLDTPPEKRVPLSTEADFVDVRTGMVYPSMDTIPGWNSQDGRRAAWVIKPSARQNTLSRVYVFLELDPGIESRVSQLDRFLLDAPVQAGLWDSLNVRHSTRLEAVQFLAEDPDLDDSVRTMIKERLFDIAELPRMDPVNPFINWRRAFEIVSAALFAAV